MLHRFTLMMSLTLVIGVASTGCSVLFMKDAPRKSLLGKSLPKCTESKTAPVVDTVIAVAALIATPILLSAEGEVDGPVLAAAGIGTGVIGLISGLSAIGGYHWARSCVDVRSKYRSKAGDGE